MKQTNTNITLSILIILLLQATPSHPQQTHPEILPSLIPKPSPKGEGSIRSYERRVTTPLSLWRGAGGEAARETPSYYLLNRQNGLGNDSVLQLMQLRDGRIVIATSSTVDIYDGQNISSIPINHKQRHPLTAYTGHTHLFIDRQDRLWMKKRHALYGFDLQRLQQISPVKFPFGNNTDDLFYVSPQQYWKVHKGLLTDGSHHITLPAHTGTLQDLQKQDSTLYAFFSSGHVIAYTTRGKELYRSAAYPDHQRNLYDNTSLVVHDGKQTFYQVRTGRGGAILQAFDTRQRRWHQLHASQKLIHTLTVTSDGMLCLTTPDGYLLINPETRQKQTFNEVRLSDGTLLSTGINAVCLDLCGGIWLGTYGGGVLYTSSLKGLFNSQPINISVQPILTAIFLNGQPLRPGATYNGHVLTDVTPPYIRQLTLQHDQNALAFQFSTMNYVRPRSTHYRYRFSGHSHLFNTSPFTNEWHTLSADSVGHLVSDNGVLYLPFTGLPPGNYTLDVIATTNPDRWTESQMRSIRLTIRPPWWKTPLAYLAYLLLTAAFVFTIFILYRRRLQRKARENMLLHRIRNLMELVNQYEHTNDMVVLGETHATTDHPSQRELSQQDKNFLFRATQLVEQHLHDPQYNVEQLAADLCMERTGLYKKLTTLMQQSPVVFIRSMRLRRAAELIRQGDMSITEIAWRTGFSTPSYFSKCFQKEFGCKPSEYEAP